MESLIPSSDDIIGSVHAYIRAKAVSSPDKLKISLLSRHFTIGKDVLKVKFRLRYGITIRKLVIQLRMEEAQKLLLNSPITVCEVAYKLGYNDVSNFSRDFKRYTKINPKDIRGVHFYRQKNIQLNPVEIFNADYFKRF